jgi:hypothetical protein
MISNADYDNFYGIICNLEKKKNVEKEIFFLFQS